MKKKVAIVGAGPGGLTAGMILASHGYQVELFEKDDRVGGRNGCMEIDGYRFDIGPTFLMMKFILEEMFEISGRKVEDYLDIRSLDPLYRLVYSDGREFFPSQDKAYLKEQIDRLFPGDWPGYLRFLEYETKKFDKITPCLQVPYSTPGAYFTPRFLKALPYMDAHFSLYKHLSKYFKHDDLRLAFTFQAKYLGMSPWKCPATFSIISFIEHTGGVHHPIGGLNKISEAMAKVIEEEGGKIHLSTPISKVKVQGGKAVGLTLEGGEDVAADYVVLNADFGYAMNHLIDVQHLKKWTPSKLKKREVSCSGFLLYLGVNRRYEDIPHHSIVFAEDYERNVSEISKTLELSEEPSIYVQNASVTDPTLAPEGKSTIYVLVPIANNRSGVDWPAETPRYREKVLDILEQRAGLADLRKHIEVERIITPKMWEDDKHVYEGAVFNLAHSLEQMLWLRPHNKFEELDNCYLVGGGTHPGSGLPTIYESGRISAGMIIKRDAWWA